MNKKIRLFMSLSIVAASGACFATVLSTRNANVFGITKAVGPEYTLVINCASDIGSVDSDFTVNTTSGNPLTFHVDNGFTKTESGLQFSGADGKISNNDPFQSIYSITVNTADVGFKNNNISIAGKNLDDEFWELNNADAGKEILLGGKNYFTINAKTWPTGSNTITSIIIKYTCTPLA